MRRWRIIGLAVVLLCGAGIALSWAWPNRDTIRWKLFGEGDGLPVLPYTYHPAFHAIGRVRNEVSDTGFGCSGTLIAPDLVITAAHCVPANGEGGITFIAGWQPKREAARREIIRSMRHPDYVPGEARKPSNDIALAVLGTPITEVAPLMLEPSLSFALIGGEVALIGYHHRAPEGLSGRYDCPMDAGSTLGRPEVLVIRCTVHGGNSGAPILAHTARGWAVIAVTNSRVGEETALAAPLDGWLTSAVAAHLAEGDGEPVEGTGD